MEPCCWRDQGAQGTGWSRAVCLGEDLRASSCPALHLARSTARSANMRFSMLCKTIIYELPSSSEVPSKVLLSLPAGSVSPHPTTPSLLILDLSIYSLDFDKPAIVLEPWTAKGVWSTCWSWDGQFVCGVGKDGTIGVWGPRQGTSVVGVSLSFLSRSAVSPTNSYDLTRYPALM